VRWISFGSRIHSHLEGTLAEAVIIGREEELALLEQRLGSIVDGGSAVVILEGDAGIGKTMLFQSGLRAAHERGYCVLSCQPSAADVQLSYAALGDLLQRVEQHELAVLPPPQRHALEVALRLRDVASAPSDPRTIALAFLNVLRELSAASPLVIAIDDAQWIDTATAAVLEFAARRLDSERLLLLVAFRRESRHGPTLDLDEGRLDGRLARLTIGPLGIDELHQLVHQRVGRLLSRPELVRVHEASGGNPFYALELARVLPQAQVGRRSGEPLPVPETLRQLVEARLAALPGSVRRVLEVAAALSEPTVELVAAASLGEDEISTALEAAVDESVIELQGDQIRFAHPLLAASAYSRMAPPRRRSLHRRLAALAGDPESRARHLALGTDKPSESVAAAAEHAARHAATRGAPGAAAELCEQAILLTPRARTEARRTRELTLVRYHLASGDVERGRAILGTLRDELPRGPARAEVLLLLARVSIYERQTNLQLLEEARAEAAGDTKLLSLIHHALGDEWMGRGDGGRALADLRKALALADECGDRSAVLTAITTLIMAEPSTGRRTRGLFERALALDPGSEDPSLSYSLRSAIALVRLYQGRLDEARALAEELLADAAALGNELSRVSGLRILALIEFRAGEWGGPALDTRPRPASSGSNWASRSRPWRTPRRS
jgi:tetratricopeptide (TPR) repeat protein